jgi:hypothetical protein
MATIVNAPGSSPIITSGLPVKKYNPFPNRFGADAFQASPAILVNDPRQLNQIAQAQLVFLAASQYQPTYKWLGGNFIPVHNRAIAEKLQNQYTASSFQELFRFCQQKGVFNVTIIPSNGLVKTAGTSPAEDSSMGHAHWVSDTLYVKDLVKDMNPALWVKSLQALATYYGNERNAFEKIIQNPMLYHHGESTQGVAHIFEPDTLTRFQDWQINYRLESHGLALKAFCDDLWERCIQNPGRQNPFQQLGTTAIDQPMLEAVCYLAHYFQAINYPHMRSCGPWEEMASPNGMTSDIEAVRSGYASLQNLLFNPTDQVNPVVQQIRAYLQQREICLNQKFGVNYPLLFQQPAALSKLIHSGEQVVQQRLMGDSISGFFPKEAPGGDEKDSALVLAASSDLCLGNTVEDDVRNHMNVFDTLAQSLVRDNGMVRYLPYTKVVKNQPIPIFDSYLGPNANLAAWPDGRLVNNKYEEARSFVLHNMPVGIQSNNPADDDPIGFLERGLLATPGKEAEWFLVSELSLGYGRQLDKLLTLLQQQHRFPSVTETTLIQCSLQAETHYLNRAYARVTGEGQNGQPLVKANGEPCPSYKVPEAYQYVSTRQFGPLVAMPGLNTPLALRYAHNFCELPTTKKRVEFLEPVAYGNWSWWPFRLVSFPAT